MKDYQVNLSLLKKNNHKEWQVDEIFNAKEYEREKKTINYKSVL